MAPNLLWPFFLCLWAVSADTHCEGLQGEDASQVMLAAARGGRWACVDQTLREGGSADAADKRGTRPLHMAAATGDARVAHVLLAAGAEVDPRDSVRVRCYDGSLVCPRAHGSMLRSLARRRCSWLP